MNHDVAAMRSELVGQIYKESLSRITAVFVASKLLMLAQVWGRWQAMIAMAAVLGLSTLINVPVMNWLFRRFSNHDRLELFRLALNIPLYVACGWLGRWQFSVWIYIIIYNVVAAMMGTPESRRRNLIFWGLLTPAALWLGASPIDLVLAGFGTYAAWLLTQTMFATLTNMMEQREVQRRELEVAHARLTQFHRIAVQQEKLAGLGMLAAGIAHEINNPMAYVTSNISTLLEDLRDSPGVPQELQQYADEIIPETLDGIKRVNAIVADLRRFARGDPEGNQEFNLNDEVEHALRIAHSHLKDECHVERRFGTIPKVVGRSQQIVQVLVNLFVNAAQAMQKGGVLKVSTSQVGEEVLLTVQDNGSGMDSATKERLFEPFFTTKPQGEGTGLGLAVVHGIVSGHGGRIEVETALGLGTKFLIHLPLRQTQVAGDDLPARSVTPLPSAA